MKKILLSPYTIILSIALGSIFGLFFKQEAQNLSLIGNVYLALLQMAIIPLLITAIVCSIGTLFRSQEAKHYVKAILLVFILGLIGVGVLGTTLTKASSIGTNLSEEQEKIIGGLIKQGESVSQAKKEENEISAVLMGIIPKNIFNAVTKGKILSILFFSLVLGLALAFVEDKHGTITLKVADELYNSFLKIISWAMVGLPFGLFFIFSSQVSKIGPEIFSLLFQYIALIYVISLSFIFLVILAISLRLKLPLTYVISGLKKTMTMAFATSSSFATLPVALESLEKYFKLDRQASHLIYPLSTCLNPLGTTLFISSMAVFMGHIYEVEFSFSSYIILAIGSGITSVAMSSAPGIAGLTLLSILLGPLGIPLAPTIIISMAALPLIDPLLTTLNVLGNCTATALVTAHVKQETELPQFGKKEFSKGLADSLSTETL